MAAKIRTGKLLYHLTSLENLHGILSHGLLPRSMVVSFRDVANPEIIEKRKTFNINDYVPFHLFCKNPFDGRVIKDYEHDFVYITIKRNKARELGGMILPTHPLAMEELVIYPFDEGFERIDWPLVETRDYSDDDCKKACMCEVIIKEGVDVKDIFSIAVHSEENLDIVKRLAKKVVGEVKSFYIDLHKDWFVERD